MHSSRMRTFRCSGHLSCHACPPATHTPLPCMPPHACPPPCMPPTMHAPCHAPPAMHASCHACLLTTHTPCYACPLQCMPPAMQTPTMHAPCNAYHPGADPGFGQGVAQVLRLKVADVAKRSRMSKASNLQPGSRARLRALEALGFLMLKYMHSPTF